MELPEVVALGIYNTRNVIRGREETTPRRTTMLELELALEDGGVSYVDAASNPITEGLFICASPGRMRHTRVPYRCAYIHFLLPEGELADLLHQCPVYFVPEKRDEIRAIFRDMTACYESRLARDRVMLQSLLLRLIYLISTDRSLKSGNGSGGGDQAIRAAIEYIHAHLNGDLRLSTVAAEVSFSPVYFHNYFRAATGMTLREYVEEQRIKRAASLLVDSDYTLSGIAYECGFSSQAYFSYAFKRRMGRTPRKYASEMLAKYGEDASAEE